MLPLKVSVPKPILLKLALGAPLITPANRVDVLSAPANKEPVPIKILPAPAIEPTVSVKLFKLNVAPDATVSADASLIRSDAEIKSVPAFTLVAPV